MADEIEPNDPSENWPEEVKKAYQHLEVPSLYDCVLANEKMSLEVRKQNREVKNAVEGMQKIATVLDQLMEIISEEWVEADDEDSDQFTRPERRNNIIEVPAHESIEGYENLSELEIQLLTDKQMFQDQTHAILIETMDSIYDLTSLSQQMNQQLFSVLPDKIGLFRQSPSWHPLAEEIVQSYITHVNHHKNRLQARLEDMHIFVIEPRPGDLFDKTLHINLEEVSGGETGVIAHVIRLGYRHEKDVLRQAEVSVFN
jgi:molecular chaperone GrpE (heat shock protein)